MGGSSKRVTVGYKYYVGMHMALCHGPVDKLVRIMVGGKKAWVGNNTGGPLTIDKPDLFGGEKREGGVCGYIDIEMGEPDQAQNSYLASKLGSALLPAFRGVMCAVLRQVYIGMNPYLKDWGWLTQRIHKSTGGAEQWYDAKAEIGAYFVDDSQTDVIDLEYKEIVPVNSSWKYITVDQLDNELHFDDIYFPGWAPFANTLPHPMVSAPFLNDPVPVLWTEIPVLSTLWVKRSITVTDKRPVNIVIRADNTATLWILNEQIVLTPSGIGLYTASFVPPYKSFDVFIRVVETSPSETNNYKYFDAYIFQDAVYDVNCSYFWGDFADMNPAHIVRECLTDTHWGMGYPESDMGDSFVDAADKLLSEQMGISLIWNQQTSIDDFVEDILRHIDAALYVDRTTGKFEIKLIRDDYDESSLLVLDQSNISHVDGYTKQTLAELVNEITVTYDSNETGQTETVTLQNLAMIQQQGAIIPAAVEYPGFANQRTAARVAARDLRAMSTPLVTATIYANREASGLNVGSVFRWNWVEEDDEGGNGIATSYVMRVTEIAYGDGVENVVRIQCAQDVFALPDITYVEADPTVWEDPSAAPLPATPRLVMETPYYEIVRQLGEVDTATKLSGLPELGYLMVAAGRQAAEINAALQVDSGAGYVEGGTLDFCPCAVLDGAIGHLDTTATLKDGVDLDEFVAGSLAQIDDEIVVIESITDGVATIRRGCLDTVPAAHADGASVIIWDGYTSGDDIEYVVSDEVDVKLLTITGQGPLAIADAPVDSVAMDQRALRPYPPANVQIGGEYYPSLVVADDLVGVVVTWAHRDRLQQTGGTVLGWTDASVGPEDGVTYSTRLVRTDTEAELDSSTAISGATVTFTPSYRGVVRLEVWSVRGGLASFQIFSHVFNYASLLPVYHGASQVYHGTNEVYHEI
jgi:hypothetical protein